MASNGTYGNLDDPFETYIDMDFLRNDKLMEDETNNNNNMSTSDLFQYFFEGEGGANEAPSSLTYQTPPHIPEGYGLISNTIMGGGDQIKLENSVQNIDSINLLTQQPQSQHSQPITSTTSAETSVSILNAQLAELLSKFQAVKQEDEPDNQLSNTTIPSDNDISTAKSKSSKGAGSENQIQIDDDSQVDIKKLSSKERRQIRNKISARNFRVRRKEYIQNLESIKNQQEEEISVLKQALVHLQEENSQLKQEVEELRKLKQPKLRMRSPPSSPHNPTTLASPEFKFNPSNGSGNLQLFTTNHQPASPTSQTTSPIWQDSRVRVQTTFIPDLYFNKYRFEEKQDFSYSNLYGGYPNILSILRDINKFDTGNNDNNNNNINKNQKFWFAYVLVSTFVQQITSLLLEAIVNTPKQQMISALFRHPVALPELLPPLKEDDGKSLDVNISDNYDDNIQVQQIIDDEQQQVVAVEGIEEEEEEEEKQLLNNNVMVESIKEASVLDWLYDSMLQQVVEQSQIEARIMELSSDWVGDDLDDNVLPLLF